MKSIRTAAIFLAALVGLSTQKMHPDVALKGAYYSAAAFCAYDTLDNWTCGRACNNNKGFSSVHRLHNSAKATFGFAGYSHQTHEIVFSFRGTNGFDVSNWMTNVNIDMDSYPGVPHAKIHSGFYDAYNGIKA
jgi:hypothetical protein